MISWCLFNIFFDRYEFVWRSMITIQTDNSLIQRNQYGLPNFIDLSNNLIHNGIQFQSIIMFVSSICVSIWFPVLFNRTIYTKEIIILEDVHFYSILLFLLNIYINFDTLSHFLSCNLFHCQLISLFLYFALFHSSRSSLSSPSQIVTLCL